MKKIDTPFLGVAYYPEDWDPSEVAKDIALMKKAGIKCVRMAEFAWSKMEPTPGTYDFQWLHDVMDQMEEAGIAIVLGTPTATPPIWLSQNHPDVMVLNAQHIRTRHGGRRHCCSNHPKYIEHSMRIVEEMAKEFGDDPRVIGWQIDNEINNIDCRCDYCLEAFRRFLEKKYGTIDNLNKAWTTTLFSQTYTSFDEIPIPEYGWHNPHIELEFLLFGSEIQARFIGDQIDILKKYTKAPIGTDTMPTNKVDYELMVEKCDIMQYNHYDHPENLHTQRFWMDFMRSQKDLPFWNTETSTCWNGSAKTMQSVKPYGFCRVNSWLPVTLGAEANMYWLWRTHHAGHEMTHGAVISASGRPLHIFDEVRQVADEFERCSDFINNTKVVSEVGIHFTSTAWNMFETQPMVDEFKYQPTLYRNIYSPVVDCGIRPDVITGGKDLSGYKLLFTPLLQTLEQRDLSTRIRKWVEDGGVWVVGPMTDIRDYCGAQYVHAPYGMLEEMTGVKQAYELPDRVGLIKCKWNDGTEFSGSARFELFEDDGDALAQVTEGYPSLIGKAPLLRKQVGKGVVYILGTVPSEEDMKKIVTMAAKDAGIAVTPVEGKLVVAPRVGENHSGLIVMECVGETGSVSIDREMKDILTGKVYSGKLELAPYELLVLTDETK